MPRRGISRAQQSIIREIVAGFLNPRDNSVALPTTGEEVGIYTSKIASYVLYGANDTGSPQMLSSTDFGRFSVIVSPTMTNKSGYANNPNSRLIIVDGGTRNTAWPGTGLVNQAMNSRCMFYGDPNIQTYANTNQTGSADEMACTGCSLLLTYNGDVIRGGGQIASHCLPAGSYYKRVISGVTPSVLNYEVLNDQIPQSYNGPLVDGTYVWWCPDSIDDLTLRAPQAGSTGPYQAADTYSPPYIVASGFITQGTTGQSTLMVTSYANFNFTRNDHTQPGYKSRATRSDLEMAVEFLNQCPKSMPNALHIAIVPALLGALAGFLTTGDAKGAVLGAIKSTGVPGVK